MEPDVEVAVVGAGPTGLLLAGDLAEAGVSVVLLEKRADVANLTRAFAVHARTLEQLDARGLADEVVALGNPVAQARAFGAIRVDFRVLRTRFPYLLVVPQYAVEEVLERRALAHGVRFLRGCTVTGLDQDADSVTLAYAGSDSAAGQVRAAYAVGCDGHRSTVRDLLGLPFPGRSVIRSVLLADVRLAQPPPDLVRIESNRAGFALVIPFGDGWHRVVGKDHTIDRAEDDPVQVDELRTLLRRVHGNDYGLAEARWLSRFHSDERQVPTYRVGRVFLAGDAAHVHTPAGGLGMNTGLQDAANLSWKLAAVVHGEDGDDLLDSYTAERHPVGRLVLRLSGGLARGLMVRSRVIRAGRALFGSIGIRVPVVGRLVLGLVSGIGVRYGLRGPIGRRAPDLVGVDGTRLYEALRARRPVLVVPTGAGPGAWSGPLLECADVRGPLLVRPDGYVAWTGRRGATWQPGR